MQLLTYFLLTCCLLSVSASAQAVANKSAEVSITIDDMDLNGSDTPRLSLDERNTAILTALRKHRKLKAALFVCGMRVDNEQGKKHLLEWDKAGHLIANHSYSHLFYPNTEFEKFSQDVIKGEMVISGLKNFQKFFRFPYLKEGRTAEQRDRIRAFLNQRNYRMGYVTIDTSEWAIDARLRKRLNDNPNHDLNAYRDFYLEHIWERAQFYDRLARQVTGGTPVRHTLLIHHNLLAALFLDDLLQMFEKKGWKLINAERAFKDPVFKKFPNVVPAGESIIWSLAKESGKFENELRYPAEDERYEIEKMDKLGL